MADYPTMPLHTDALIADTQHLDNEEFGIYSRLLIFAWRTPDCCLPNDDKRLAIMVGVTPGKWAKLKPIVMSFWSLDGDVWRQKKQTEVRRVVARSVAQKSVAGTASAKAKALKINKPGSTAVPTAKPTARQQPKPKPKESPLIPQGEDDLFGENKPPPKTPTELLAEVVRPDLAEAFVEHRKSLGKTKELSEKAANLMANKLRTFSDPNAAIESSIMNGYQGVFETAKKPQFTPSHSTGHEGLLRSAREGAP